MNDDDFVLTLPCFFIAKKDTLKKVGDIFVFDERTSTLLASKVDGALYYFLFTDLDQARRYLAAEDPQREQVPVPIPSAAALASFLQELPPGAVIAADYETRTMSFVPMKAADMLCRVRQVLAQKPTNEDRR